MVYLVVSVLLTILLVVNFKYFEILDVPTFPAIVVNYWICVFSGLSVGVADFSVANIATSSWWPFTLLMGSFFIGGFYLIALATQRTGLAAASVANKLSMVIPVAVAFWLYGDTLTIGKVLGICGAIASVFLVSIKADDNWAKIKKHIQLPIAVFLIGGFLETVLNYVQKDHLQESEFAPFLIMSFGIAGLVGTLILLFQRRAISRKVLLGGICLGVPNFFSLYFFLKALNSSGLQSSQIFPINSIAIVALAAITGLLLFRERLSTMNWIGLAIACGSIVLITL